MDNSVKSSIEKKESIQSCFLNYMKNPDLYGDKMLLKLNNCKDFWIKERDTNNSRIWRNNAMFYAGNHYVRDVYNAGNQYRVRLRENHINNTITRLLSIMVQNMPIVRVFPSSDSSEDQQDAENTEMYGKYFWRTKKIDQKFMKFVKYTLIFGNAFVYRAWNPDMGGKIMLGAEDTEGGEKEIYEYRGDLEIGVDDPFKIAVRPGIEDYEDMFDIVRSVPVARAMLEDKYGPIEADSVVTYNSYSGEMRHDDDSVVLHSYYHKPTPWFEEGCMVQWAGNKILKARPATESEKELPIVHLGFDKIPMKFWSQSGIEQVIDLQEQLNRAASMIVESRNLMSRPRVLASHQSKVPAQSITDRPGDIVRYDMAGGKPEFITPQFNFAELSAHKGDLRNALQMVSGITSASRGEIPSATRTALALQLVLEQDRSQYLPFIKSFHQSILDTMRGVFSEVAEKMGPEDPRTIKVEGRIMTTRTFHGGMVPSVLDLYLEDTNPLGWTAGARIENTMELARLGVIKDPNKLLEMLKISSPDPAFDSQNINRATQQKENQELSQGKWVDIGTEDDDIIHLEEITKVMATFEYKSRPGPVKAAFEKHATAHKKRLMEAQVTSTPPAGKISAGDVNPQMAQEAMLAPEPGRNINKLLTSARAG